MFRFFLFVVILHHCPNSVLSDWDSFQWIPRESLTQNAHRLTPAGSQNDGPLYICRGGFSSHWYPGKLSIRDNKFTCQVPANGVEFDVGSNFEVLYVPPGTVKWTNGARSKIPDYAIAVGSDVNTGETSYLGRAIHEGMEIPGKIVKQWKGGICLFGYGGDQHEATEFEVLTLTLAGQTRVNLTAVL